MHMHYLMNHADPYSQHIALANECGSQGLYCYQSVKNGPMEAYYASLYNFEHNRSVKALSIMLA